MRSARAAAHHQPVTAQEETVPSGGQALPCPALCGYALCGYALCPVLSLFSSLAYRQM
ncbi:hypothetical protein AWZ03_014902, partial [Drosophila navojoa]